MPITQWMDVPRAEPSTAKRPPTFTSLAVLLSGLLVYVVVWELLDPPSTWTKCPRPSPAEVADLSARRDEFLALALPLAAAYTVFLAASAWRWAADRRARQRDQRRPGRLARGAGILIGSAWLLLIGRAFTGDAVGGAIFWGLLLTAAGAIVSAALAIAVLVGAFHSSGRSHSEDVIDSLWVGLFWSILLFALPLFVIRIGVVGKDVTLFC